MPLQSITFISRSSLRFLTMENGNRFFNLLQLMTLKILSWQKSPAMSCPQQIFSRFTKSCKINDSKTGKALKGNRPSEPMICRISPPFWMRRCFNCGKPSLCRS
uniref:Putative disease resistance protein At4g27220 n=1 Tax=Rhizophora mucronata TaxID=61149 RepID=A0A2P2M5S9_RHIMU